MRYAIAAELAVSMLAGLAFLVTFVRRRHRDRVIAWHIAVFSGSTAVADGALLLLALGVRLPVWVFLLAYGAQGAVVVQRLWLELHMRHQPWLTLPKECDMWTRKFWMDAAERAAKSAAQAALLYFGGDQVFDAWQAHWAGAGAVALGAAVLSVLTSLVSAKVGDSSSASLVDTR
jgi:hypothetical protein